MEKLTDNQRKLLMQLEDGPLTAKQLTLVLNNLDSIRRNTIISVYHTYDEIHSSLRRLENRELVRRLGGIPAEWELTSLGRRSIQ